MPSLLHGRRFVPQGMSLDPLGPTNNYLNSNTYLVGGDGQGVNSPFSIEIWVRMNPSWTHGGFLIAGAATSWQVGIDQNFFTLNLPASNTSNVPLVGGRWWYQAAAFNGAGWICYGGYEGDALAPQAASTGGAGSGAGTDGTSAVYIGVDNNSAGNSLTGQIGLLRVWNASALSLSDMIKYRSLHLLRAPGLTFNWDPAQSLLTDLVTGTPFTITGAPAWSGYYPRLRAPQPRASLVYSAFAQGGAVGLPWGGLRINQAVKRSAYY